jgi:hypothetical protein
MTSHRALPLEPAIAAARGLTPAERARAVERAKGVAFQFVTAVRNGSAAGVQRVANGLDWHEMAALAVVLAEAADPVKLKVVKEARDPAREPAA